MSINQAKYFYLLVARIYSNFSESKSIFLNDTLSSNRSIFLHKLYNKTYTFGLLTETEYV